MCTGVNEALLPQSRPGPAARSVLVSKDRAQGLWTEAKVSPDSAAHSLCDLEQVAELLRVSYFLICMTSRNETVFQSAIEEMNELIS